MPVAWERLKTLAPRVEVGLKSFRKKLALPAFLSVRTPEYKGDHPV